MATRIVGFNGTLTIVLALLWTWQESSYWNFGWFRTILMLLLVILTPAFGVVLLVSHAVSLEAEIPQGARSYRRMMHLFTIIGLISIAAVLPEWSKFTTELAATRGTSTHFLDLASVNWQSAVASRLVMALIPPVGVWCFRQAPFYLAPILFVFSIVSLPALLAGCLVLREVRSRHQRNVETRN